MAIEGLLFMILLALALRIVQAVLDHREMIRRLDALLEALRAGDT